MQLDVAALAFAASDPVALARWWHALLGGGTIAYDRDVDASITTPGGLAIDFSREPVAKDRKNRLHLDLRGAAYEDAVARALELGAARADDVYDGDAWTVLRDREGNEFCILRPRTT